MIKVFIAVDSQSVNQYLNFILSNDPEIIIIGNAFDGQEVLDSVKINKPDIIIMDLMLPKINGFEVTKRIMASDPTPILIVISSANANINNISKKASAVGAISVINIPIDVKFSNTEIKSTKLVSLIKTYSQVKVITRTKTITKVVVNQKLDFNGPPINKLHNIKYIAIGISSGGPNVLKQILLNISCDFPYPILIVQHISKGFLENMVSWLNKAISIPVHIAIDKEILLPGHIYFAPNNAQMGIKLNRIELFPCFKKTIICPSVSYLFDKLAIHHGKKVMALLLTGMGTDGAKEMRLLRDKGAITIVQDKESSIAYGMPGEAIKLGGAKYILSSDKITQLLLRIESNSKIET